MKILSMITGALSPFKDISTFALVLLAFYTVGPIITEAPRLIALVIAPVSVIAMTRWSISRDKSNNYNFGLNAHTLSEMSALVILIFAAVHYSIAD